MFFFSGTAADGLFIYCIFVYYFLNKSCICHLKGGHWVTKHAMTDLLVYLTYSKGALLG